MRFPSRDCLSLLRSFGLIAVAWFIAACDSSPAASGAPAPSTPAPPKSAADSLPNAPEKALVLQFCQDCHDLDWIARSGGTKEGWEDRLVRMIRAGATIPPAEIPAVASYLAKAFPPRPIPPDKK